MITIGGVTRLTLSGLSMVEWQPLLGAIPPLSEQEWQETFEKYQNFPQYQKLNSGMTLGEFKKIFFWEYLHRLFGRLIGVAFFFPWMWFIYKKKIPAGVNLKLAGLFALGGLQGLMGWYMVKSGLVDNPAVSHYRLAVHLILAFAVMVFSLLLILRLSGRERAKNSPRNFLNLSYVVTGVIVLQIVYGAFTAGLKAGYGMNTFPTMNGEWIPSVAFSMTPFWHNLIENNFGVQFIHRALGWLLLFGITALWLSAWLSPLRNQLSGTQHKALQLLLAMTATQFTLGALTIVFVVPLGLAVAHQLGASALLLLAVSLNYSLSPARTT
jgi:heme a synthase